MKNIMPPINHIMLMLGGHQKIVYLLRFNVQIVYFIFKACAIDASNPHLFLPHPVQDDIPGYHQAGNQVPCILHSA